MDGVQLPQGYRATSRRQFTFYHQVPRKFWYSFDQPWKDESLVYLLSASTVQAENTYSCILKIAGQVWENQKRIQF